MRLRAARDVVQIHVAMKADPKRARSVADVRARLAAEHKRATKRSKVVRFNGAVSLGELAA